MNCLHCDTPVDPKEAKHWRWVGWVVWGPAPSSPARVGKDLDEWDHVFHKDCFPEWLHNRNEFLQDLDRPVNACAYFQRTGSSMHGYYVRDGKKHACLASWTQADILNTALFPTVTGEFKLDHPELKVVVTNESALVEIFRDFLSKNGWLNEGWYEPRKPVVYKEEVLKKRRATYGSGPPE
jgi:hypothetical protein